MAKDKQLQAYHPCRHQENAVASRRTQSARGASCQRETSKLRTRLILKKARRHQVENN